MNRSICFVSLNAYHLLAETQLSFIGGAELQQVLIGRELANRGYSVSFITLDHGQGPVTKVGNLEVIATYKPSDGIPVIRFFFPRLLKIWQALNKSKADIYYVRCAGFILAVVVAWARLKNKKVIYCGANDPDFKPKELELKYHRDKVMFFWGLKRCSAIVVQNLHQKETLQKNFMRDSVIIHNGMEKKAEIPKGKETILWVANIKPAKAPEIFIDLAMQMPNEKFVMIGGKVDGHEDLYEFVSTESAKLPNLDFKGFQPLEKTEQEFRRAKLHVNTSLHEGFPNSFLQAWRQGIPVISFLDPDQLIARNSLGRVARDKNEMLEMLKTIANHEEKINSNSIKKFFDENLTIEKQVDKYEELFESLMNFDG
ncbi:MAG: hypothetical protein NPINA01_03420 [Nitrospinaceae bacterium]|nr:MAG: hypothetical protein NPINA01_03420 [Nitrospinaceae bacterium]